MRPLSMWRLDVRAEAGRAPAEASRALRRTGRSPRARRDRGGRHGDLRRDRRLAGAGRADEQRRRAAVEAAAEQRDRSSAMPVLGGRRGSLAPRDSAATSRGKTPQSAGRDHEVVEAALEPARRAA